MKFVTLHPVFTGVYPCKNTKKRPISQRQSASLLQRYTIKKVKARNVKITLSGSILQSRAARKSFTDTAKASAGTRS